MIWETIGGKVLETLYKHMAKLGRLVVIGGISGYKDVGFPSASLPGFPGDVKICLDMRHKKCPRRPSCLVSPKVNSLFSAVSIQVQDDCWFCCY